MLCCDAVWLWLSCSNRLVRLITLIVWTDRSLICLFVCLFVCLFIIACITHSLTHLVLSTSLAYWLFICPSATVSRSLSPSVCLSVCLPFCLSLLIWVVYCLMFNSQSVVCLCLSLSVCLSVSQCLCLSCSHDRYQLYALYKCFYPCAALHSAIFAVMRRLSNVQPLTSDPDWKVTTFFEVEYQKNSTTTRLYCIQTAKSVLKLFWLSSSLITLVFRHNA